MGKKQLKFSDELRRAVDDCGLTRYRIAKALGVSESLLSRFMSGEWLGQESLDALAGLLDLHLAAPKSQRVMVPGGKVLELYGAAGKRRKKKG
jgi:transcriptional regulator with XRE-family HTH domain